MWSPSPCLHFKCREEKLENLHCWRSTHRPLLVWVVMRVFVVDLRGSCITQTHRSDQLGITPVILAGGLRTLSCSFFFLSLCLCLPVDWLTALQWFIFIFSLFFLWLLFALCVSCYLHVHLCLITCHTALFRKNTCTFVRCPAKWQKKKTLEVNINEESG